MMRGHDESLKAGFECYIVDRRDESVMIASYRRRLSSDIGISTWDEAGRM